MYVELAFEGFPKLELGVGRKEQVFDLSEELKALECAVRLLSHFDVTDHVDISFDEISTYKTQICEMEKIFNSSQDDVIVEFGVDGEGFDPSKEVACIFLVTAPIGSHIFGLFFVVIGPVKELENELFKLETKGVVIEKKIISERDRTIKCEDLIAETEKIESKYDNDYSVVTMFKKRKQEGRAVRRYRQPI